MLAEAGDRTARWNQRQRLTSRARRLIGSYGRKLVRHDADQPLAVRAIGCNRRRRFRLVAQAKWARETARPSRSFDELIGPASTLVANDHPASGKRILAIFRHRGENS